MSKDRVHIVIVGGGVAAIETLLALRELAGDRVRITLLSRERDFLYRPVTVAEAFDRAQARAYSLDEIVGYERGDQPVWDSLERVDADEHVAVTGKGTRIRYDFLVVASGAIRVSDLECSTSRYLEVLDRAMRRRETESLAIETIEPEYLPPGHASPGQLLPLAELAEARAAAASSPCPPPSASGWRRRGRDGYFAEREPGGAREL